MTAEKAVVAGWTRTPGWRTDDELRAFALALARKRSRFAFPDDFVAAAQALQRRFVDKHDKETVEGAHLRALREIRVRAAPSWSDEQVRLGWWFVKNSDPENVDADWPSFLDQWIALFDQTGRFRLDPPTACRLEDMTARDYVESDPPRSRSPFRPSTGITGYRRCRRSPPASPRTGPRGPCRQGARIGHRPSRNDYFEGRYTRTSSPFNVSRVESCWWIRRA